MSKTVLVTGVAGYIGGQTALALIDKGYTVVGLDRVDLPSHLQDVCNGGFYKCDFEEIPKMNIMRTQNIEAIIHCAGSSLVGESVTNPSLYYENNFVKTKILLDYLIAVKLAEKVRVIFSSTASTYGEPVMTPCSEEDPPLPINPYGESKLMIEQMMKSYRQAYNLDFVAFRYFNAAGADSQGRHGQAPGATHIIARILESVRDKQPFVLNGNTYATPDGSCIRDYIHVEDIVEAHILALDTEIPSGVYNLSTGTGVSNYEVINTVNDTIDHNVDVTVGPGRVGDPLILVASPDLFMTTSGWKPKYTLKDMIKHAWGWYKR